MKNLLALPVTVTVLLAAPGCSCGFPYSIPDYPDAGTPHELPADAREVPEDGLDPYTACAVHDHAFPEDRLVEVTAELASRDDGLLEIPISDDECVRFVREIEGGTLARAEFIAFTGEIVFAIDPDGELLYGARFVTIARWERGSDGTLTGRIDLDGDLWDADDDFYEVETIERDGYYRVSRANAASREVDWRLTIEETGTQRIQTTEQLAGTSLAVIDRTSLDVENEMGGPSSDECLANKTACDAATIASLETSLARAMARGTSCMAGLNLPAANYESDVWQRLQGLKNLWTQAHSWSCMPAGCTFGHWCEGCGPSGGNQIDIGYDEWSMLPQNMQLGVLFHEFMHGVIGGHLDVVVNSSIESPTSQRDRLMRRYVDRVDACEAYCFGGAPTRCSCATCLDVRTCDARCTGLASCRVDDCTSGSGGCVPIMSEAVGAACVTVGPGGEESATWSATLAGCRMSGCASSGGECRSYSRSCETGCE